jgi:hypothetical protein
MALRISVDRQVDFSYAQPWQFEQEIKRPAVTHSNKKVFSLFGI